MDEGLGQHGSVHLNAKCEVEVVAKLQYPARFNDIPVIEARSGTDSSPIHSTNKWLLEP